MFFTIQLYRSNFLSPGFFSFFCLPSLIVSHHSPRGAGYIKYGCSTTVMDSVIRWGWSCTMQTPPLHICQLLVLTQLFGYTKLGASRPWIGFQLLFRCSDWFPGNYFQGVRGGIIFKRMRFGFFFKNTFTKKVFYQPVFQ